METNNRKQKIMFIDDKTNIEDEITHINCTLGQISEIDRRLRIDKRNYISQIKELNVKNKNFVAELIQAKERENKAKNLRYRDIGILLCIFVAFAGYVTYVSF